MGRMETFAAAEPAPLSPECEKDEVFRWRQEQFRQLGLDRGEAAELAASDADLAQARYLLGSGCSVQLALRILR
jgi:hypothetical protein